MATRRRVPPTFHPSTDPGRALYSTIDSCVFFFSLSFMMYAQSPIILCTSTSRYIVVGEEKSGRSLERERDLFREIRKGGGGEGSLLFVVPPDPALLVGIQPYDCAGRPTYSSLSLLLSRRPSHISSHTRII